MFVIIKHGGKQYWAKTGDTLSLEKIEGNVGDEIKLDVICEGKDKKIEINNKQILAKITKHFKDDKIIIFKKKRRHHYERKKGHRQMLTNVKIANFA